MPRRARTLWIAAMLALVACASLALVACADAGSPDVPGAELRVERIRVGVHEITAEIAATEAERRRGLMFRESLPPDHGMLFVFPQEKTRGFWMRNTKIPLSIAYADASGRIVRIADLEPFDERPVTSVHPSRYALEMERGWFREHAVYEGDRIEGIPEG